MPHQPLDEPAPEDASLDATPDQPEASASPGPTSESLTAEVSALESMMQSRLEEGEK